LKTIFETQNNGKMLTKFKYAVFLLVAFLAPCQTFAQGVPKAYEAISYHGKVNGQRAIFILAAGYIGASSVKMYMPGKTKPFVFEPDAGVADEHNRLKFIPAKPGGINYFILNNMQETYEETPALITGSYFLNNKKIPVKFYASKSKR
jgi:hypothetical protein